jgi:acyl-CoA reductase-like NAD-dependent aldehyde dehydrogenase
MPPPPAPLRTADQHVTTDDTTLVTPPYAGRQAGRGPKGGPHDNDPAVAAAVECRDAGPRPAHERADILDRAATLLAERTEAFARSIADEAAKPLKTARVEAARAVDTFRFAATAARTLTGEMVPMDASAPGEGKLGFVLRHPIGVVAGISPFNFPLNLVAHKVAPAIAAGCPLVLKPASATPLTALRLADLLLDECGLPPGWLNVVTVGGSVADHLVEHDDVAMITFTGSPDVGWGIRGKAPRKKVSLELGNNTPLIVDERSDWRSAAAKVSVAGYAFAGQSCISVQRLFVHEAVHDDFVAELASLVDALRVGDPLDENTDVSSLIDAGETERVRAWIDEAVGEGAKIVTGGAVEGSVLRPTILDGVTPDMQVCRTEVFGPVVGVQSFAEFDEALALANDSRYGLQAGVYTDDLDHALHAARTLEYGGITINEVPTFRADQMPYGGTRDSGNTKEGPAYAVREMTEARLVVLEG